MSSSTESRCTEKRGAGSIGSIVRLSDRTNGAIVAKELFPVMRQPKATRHGGWRVVAPAATNLFGVFNECGVGGFDRDGGDKGVVRGREPAK